MANRTIVYVGEIPYDTDALQAEKNMLQAVGHLAGAVYGEGVTAGEGFACAPGSGLSVTIGPGSVYAPGPIDATGYGTLGTDATQVTQQYTLDGTTTLTVPGSGTYFVYITPTVVDGGTTVLGFYNSANPALTFQGQNNTGQGQATIRYASAVPGIGSSVPQGSLGIWEIVVPSGATAITQAMISAAPGSPIQPTIPQLAQQVVQIEQEVAQIEQEIPLLEQQILWIQRFDGPLTGASSENLSGTAPAGCYALRYLLQAAGGPGGAGNGSGAGGGGSGGGCAEGIIPVSPGMAWTATLGAPGNAPSGNCTLSINGCQFTVNGGDGGALGGSAVVGGNTNFGTATASGSLVVPSGLFQPLLSNGQSGQNGVLSGSLLLGGEGGTSAMAPGGHQNVAVSAGGSSANQPGNSGYRGSGGSGGTGSSAGGYGGSAHLSLEWLA